MDDSPENEKDDGIEGIHDVNELMEHLRSIIKIPHGLVRISRGRGINDWTPPTTEEREEFRADLSYVHILKFYIADKLALTWLGNIGIMEVYSRHARENEDLKIENEKLKRALFEALLTKAGLDPDLAGNKEAD